MEVTLKLNQEYKQAGVEFACETDFDFLAKWKNQLGTDQHPHRRDAVDFAQLALFRYSAHCATEPYAQASTDFEDYIRDNPQREVACLVFLKCNWFGDSEIIGLTHFRRTWTNRIVLDYLCAHPFITKPPPRYPQEVKGVGSALLYFVAHVAEICDCDTIWGEATQNSCTFYQHVFRLESVRDLIYAPRPNFLEFARKVESGWAKSPMEANPVLTEMYRIEAESPPFVGSKTAVFNAPRDLVVHFLDLPLHLKIEVARTFGLSEANNGTASDSELFQQIFQSAAETARLADLWREVESRHREGNPYNNPFNDGQ